MASVVVILQLPGYQKSLWWKLLSKRHGAEVLMKHLTGARCTAAARTTISCWQQYQHISLFHRLLHQPSAVFKLASRFPSVVIFRNKAVQYSILTSFCNTLQKLPTNICHHVSCQEITWLISKKPITVASRSKAWTVFARRTRLFFDLEDGSGMYLRNFT
jgi:hypothetical protein